MKKIQGLEHTYSHIRREYYTIYFNSMIKAERVPLWRATYSWRVSQSEGALHVLVRNNKKIAGQYRFVNNDHGALPTSKYRL